MREPAGNPASTTWVVVGASRGIGLEFVKQLLESGQRVIATVRNPDGAKELSSVIEAQGNPENCMIEQCDVASSESIDYTCEEWGATGTYQDFALHLETNVIGPIICAQKLINLEPRCPPSKVIFISSDSGSAINFLGHEDGYAAYAASKSALNQTLRHMAAELKRRGGRWAEICVLALHPGEVNTDMNSVSVPWDLGIVLETNESVQGMLKVIGEKNNGDSGTFWCWDGKSHPW
ncbi:hypothetical protein LZL87_012853 [Fusarium oxysporum]|nr:hypothetical protein LZL87_012853 [Fusarium oxysporum]